MLLHGAFSNTPLDRDSLAQSTLDIANRSRTNHFPWTGQFSPQFAEAVLSAYGPAEGVVLDPFVGSGTSLVEAARLGLAASGADLNPAALALARVYELVNLERQDRALVLGEMEGTLAEGIGPPHGPLFSPASEAKSCRANIEATLVEMWRDARYKPMEILAAALVVLCDFHQKHLDADKVHATWLRLARIVRTLPESPSPINVSHADARDLPMDTDSADLVFTSPPYINVFNYHQKYRRSVEALNWNILAVARSEIGSNRQNRGNRFLTVVQYSLDMALAIREAARVTRRRGRLIFVLGRESKVRGTAFYNGELIAELAVRCVGLTLERRQERVFQNRYGADIYEDILHLRAAREVPEESACLLAARHVAGEVLGRTAACLRAPEKERRGLDEAIKRLSEVSPSPMLATPKPGVHAGSAVMR